MFELSSGRRVAAAIRPVAACCWRSIDRAERACRLLEPRWLDRSLLLTLFYRAPECLLRTFPAGDGLHAANGRRRKSRIYRQRWTFGASGLPEGGRRSKASRPRYIDLARKGIASNLSGQSGHPA